MEAATAWIEEAEERIGELGDKIMGKKEGEKKRDKKNPGVWEENERTKWYNKMKQYP